MEYKRYKPLIGKMFWWTWIPLTVLLIAIIVVSLNYPLALILTIGVGLFCYYFLVSSLVEVSSLTLFDVTSSV